MHTISLKNKEVNFQEIIKNIIKILILFHLFTLSLFALNKGTVISSKSVNGTDIFLVKVEASVLPNMGENGADGTKSIVFNKLDGSTGLSKQSFKNVPNAHNNRVTVYYIEKNNEKSKYEYRVFFNKDDVLFSKEPTAKPSPQREIETTIETTEKESVKNENITEIGNVKHTIRDFFENSVVYVLLFFTFLKLNGVFGSLDAFLNKKINYLLQTILILIFLFGGERIIRTENSTCYQTPYITEGKVDYFIDEPYVKFVDCYGHQSKSERKNPELLGKAKDETVKIYYNHLSREYYSNEDTNIYRVFTTIEAYEKEQETPLHFYFGLLMLFVLIVSYISKNKKLYVPSLVSSRKPKIHTYNKSEDKYFSELLDKVDKDYYSIGDTEEYFIDPIVYTESNKISIERFKLWNILIPTLVITALLWAFSRGFSVLTMDDVTSDEKIIISVIGLFGLAFLYITVTNILAKKEVGIFDFRAKLYKSFLEDTTVPFDKIYAYTLTYKRVQSRSEDDWTSLYELDMVLTNGDVVNLYAREHDKEAIYNEAKIIASSTNKPIYDFQKKDINKIFRIRKSQG